MKKEGAIVNYVNDPLLNNSSLTYYSEKRYLNIYRMLSSYEKGISSLLIYYKIDNESKEYTLNLLFKKFGKNINDISKLFLKYIAFYRSKDYSSRREVHRIKCNLLKGNLTLEYVRIISLMAAERITDSIVIFNAILERAKFLRDRKGKRIKIPLKIEEIQNPFLVYFSGVVCGDGHISKNMSELVIADGTRDESLLIYSKEYLENISKTLTSRFNISTSLSKKGKYYRLGCYSNFITRFMNYFYNIPTGKKSTLIKVPILIKNTKRENLFWRGIFDTDGHVRIKNKAIGLSTNSNFLCNDLFHFLSSKNINYFKQNQKKVNKILIAEDSFLKFAKVIGFSHPRKQRNLIKHLEKGASYNLPIKKGTNKRLENVIEYLRPYKHNVYIRLTKKREKVNQEELARRIKFIENSLGIRAREIKKNRKNNHFYICSIYLVREINKYYSFAPSWDALKENNLQELKETWKL